MEPASSIIHRPSRTTFTPRRWLLASEELTLLALHPTSGHISMVKPKMCPWSGQPLHFCPPHPNTLDGRRPSQTSAAAAFSGVHHLLILMIYPV